MLKRNYPFWKLSWENVFVEGKVIAGCLLLSHECVSNVLHVGMIFTCLDQVLQVHSMSWSIESQSTHLFQLRQHQLSGRAWTMWSSWRTWHETAECQYMSSQPIKPIKGGYGVEFLAWQKVPSWVGSKGSGRVWGKSSKVPTPVVKGFERNVPREALGGLREVLEENRKRRFRQVLDKAALKRPAQWMLSLLGISPELILAQWEMKEKVFFYWELIRIRVLTMMIWGWRGEGGGRKWNSKEERRG